MMDGGADDELLMQLKFTTVSVMVRKMRVLKRKKMMLTMALPVLKLQVVAFLTTMVAATTVDGDAALLLMIIQVLTLMIMLLMNHEDVDDGTVDHGEHVDVDGGYGGAHVDAQDMLLRPPMMMLIMVMRRRRKRNHKPRGPPAESANSIPGTSMSQTLDPTTPKVNPKPQQTSILPTHQTSNSPAYSRGQGCLGCRPPSLVHISGFNSRRSKRGVSRNRGPKYSTRNSRILIIRTPKEGTVIWKVPNEDAGPKTLRHDLIRNLEALGIDLNPGGEFSLRSNFLAYFLWLGLGLRGFGCRGVKGLGV